MNVPASGAAGGAGAALMAFLNGKLINRIDLILEILGFEEALQQTDLIFTVDGKIDSQTLL